MKSVTKFSRGVIFAAALAFASFAKAEELAPTTDSAASDFSVEVMSADELGELSGGTGMDAVIITDETLNAINHDNSVTGDVVTTGDISISQGALAGFGGIGNFVMNTGHNNNLQASMSVSILLGDTSGDGP